MNANIVCTAIPPIQYQAAVEAIGFVKGYIDGNDYPFSERFVDAIRALSQFVDENPPQLYELCQNPITSNIEGLMETMKGSETK